MGYGQKNLSEPVILAKNIVENWQNALEQFENIVEKL